jgi:hypothetical protein
MDNHLVIIGIVAVKTYRLINVYRVFNTFSSISPFDKFKNQLECIEQAACNHLIIVGDFNLIEEMKYLHNYQCWKYFEELNSV